jgi:hypothetical protein
MPYHKSYPTRRAREQSVDRGDSSESFEKWAMKGKAWFQKFEQSRYCVPAKTDRTMNVCEFWIVMLLTRVVDGTYRLMEVTLSFREQKLLVQIFDRISVPDEVEDKCQFVRDNSSLGWMGFGFELEDSDEEFLPVRYLPASNMTGGLYRHRRTFETVQKLYDLLESREFETLRNIE